MIWIWVRVVGTGAKNDAYRPELPPGMEFTSNDSMIMEEWRRPGRMAVTYANVGIHEADADKVNAVAPENVPEQDRILTQMLRTCRDDWDAKTGAFFDANPPQDNTASKQASKYALLFAVHRGMEPQKANAIRAKHGLPVGASKHGIDGDIYDAAKEYIVRKHDVADVDAEAALNRYLAKGK